MERSAISPGAPTHRPTYRSRRDPLAIRELVSSTGWGSTDWSCHGNIHSRSAIAVGSIDHDLAIRGAEHIDAGWTKTHARNASEPRTRDSNGCPGSSILGADPRHYWGNNRNCISELIGGTGRRGACWCRHGNIHGSTSTGCRDNNLRISSTEHIHIT